MKLTLTLDEIDFLQASLGLFVDGDNVDEADHAVASDLLDRLLDASRTAKNTPLDQPFSPTSFNTIAELEVGLEAAERYAKWESAWNEQCSTNEFAKRDAEVASAMTSRLRAALQEVLTTRTIEIVVLPDRGK